MAHALMHISRHDARRTAFERVWASMAEFKQIEPDDVRVNDFTVLVIAAARNKQPVRIEISQDQTIWLAVIGTWFTLPATRNGDVQWLLEIYQREGAVGLGRRVQGFFAILIVDERMQCAHVVTDRCGSLHIFYRQDKFGVTVSTSSAALGLGSSFDPVSVHEFIATGNVYEDRTLFANVHKLFPAAVTTFFADGRFAVEHYWKMTDVATESLSCADAADAMQAAIVRVLGVLPENDRPIVSDLTGGYDSRLLMAGLLSAGVSFETTVTGLENHQDVLVAERIAKEFGIPHSSLLPAQGCNKDIFESAVRLSDGECDAFDYTNILQTHRYLSGRFSMSLNGSFGELARGYWWELLWPSLAKNKPLDVAMLARKRFAAVPYNHRVLAGEARFDLTEHMTEVLGRAVSKAQGLPNTSQLDWVYYTVRMQRWQGRIASSTNQLWPAISPLGFSEVLDPILATKASARFGSLLDRVYFERHASRLACIPLEHGYPPCRITPFNFWLFSPLLGYYLGRVRSKLADRLFSPESASSVVDQANIPALRHARLFEEWGMEMWFSSLRLAECGLFDEAFLLAACDPHRVCSGSARDGWQRLMTLEALLRLTPSGTVPNFAFLNHLAV